MQCALIIVYNAPKILDKFGGQFEIRWLFIWATFRRQPSVAYSNVVMCHFLHKQQTASFVYAESYILRFAHTTFHSLTDKVVDLPSIREVCVKIATEFTSRNVGWLFNLLI